MYVDSISFSSPFLKKQTKKQTTVNVFQMPSIFMERKAVYSILVLRLWLVESVISLPWAFFKGQRQPGQCLGESLLLMLLLCFLKALKYG